METPFRYATVCRNICNKIKTENLKPRLTKQQHIRQWPFLFPFQTVSFQNMTNNSYILLHLLLYPFLIQSTLSNCCLHVLVWSIIQSDSKRWTQLSSKRRLNTCQTVGSRIPSSLLALRVDLRGLRSKLSWIRLTFSSDTRGWPEVCLYTDSLFAQIGYSSDKCCSSFEVECWNEDETHAAQQSPTQF